MEDVMGLTSAGTGKSYNHETAYRMARFTTRIHSCGVECAWEIEGLLADSEVEVSQEVCLLEMS